MKITEAQLAVLDKYNIDAEEEIREDNLKDVLNLIDYTVIIAMNDDDKDEAYELELLRAELVRENEEN